MKEKIKSIMDNFDFDKVQEFLSWNKAYRHYDITDDGIELGYTTDQWKMLLPNGNFGVPTVTDLKVQAYKLLIEAASKKENWSIQTGCFLVIKRENCLALYCVIEDWYD